MSSGTDDVIGGAVAESQCHVSLGTGAGECHHVDTCLWVDVDEAVAPCANGITRIVYQTNLCAFVKVAVNEIEYSELYAVQGVGSITEGELHAFQRSKVLVGETCDMKTACLADDDIVED